MIDLSFHFPREKISTDKWGHLGVNFQPYCRNKNRKMGGADHFDTRTDDNSNKDDNYRFF